MTKLGRYMRASITRRFVAMLLVATLLILAGAGALLARSYSKLADFSEAQRQLKHKETVITEIAAHTNQVFFRARGYYAFLNATEREQVFSEKASLDASLAMFKRMPLNEKEYALAESVEQFLDDFLTNVFPKASAMVESGDYAALRELSSSGINNAVNDMINYAAQFRIENEAHLAEQNEEMIDNLFREGMLFIAYVMGILLLSSVIATRTARDLGRPLGKLSADAERFARGEQVHLDQLEREDEIGKLSRSLDFLMVQIMAKEEELLAQNEELAAQQEELQNQQQELQEALAKMEENERYLEKRNRLIQSLTNTLDKGELLNSIVRHTAEMTASDKGLILLLNEDRDAASFGIAAEGVKRFVREAEQDALIRVQETGHTYIAVRPSADSEMGFHTERFQVYDCYLPILNAEQEMIACLVLSRLGRAYTPEEQIELESLVKQLSLSLDKLKIFEEKERQWQVTQDMLDTIQEGVQLLDREGNTVQVNRMMCELIGFERAGKVTGVDLQAFLSMMRDRVGDYGKLAGFIEGIFGGEECEQGPESVSCIYHIPEPYNRYIHMYCEPLYRNRERIGTLLVHRDMTKEHQVDQMKSEFVSTVSHELRTPLSSVLGFTELLLNKELKPERQRKYLQTIHQEANRLTSLINDFLDLQRMESGRQSYEFVPLQIADMIEEAIELYRISTPNREFRVELLTSRHTISGDQDRIRQVLMNLLSNAVKYSPGGGTITVTCREQGQSLAIDIADEGLGIPEEAIPRLFTKFYRVDNSDRREIGGTGLGLAIVKEIISVHKGHISVHSVYGKGTTITIVLPLAEQQQTQQTQHVGHLPYEGETKRGEGPVGKVVIVEDDSSLSELMKDELLEKGFEVYQYSNGKDALQAIRTVKPDVVVLDLVLEQGWDGWDVIGRMRADTGMAAVPIVISSAFEERQRASELGASAYLIKPFHPSMLSQTLLGIIGGRGEAAAGRES